MKEMISVTVPVFNEENNIDVLYEKLVTTLKGMECDFEIIFVNDGSSDTSPDILNDLSTLESCLMYQS